MLHNRYIMLLSLLLACLSTFGQVRDVVIKNGAYYTTANIAVDTIYNQKFLKDSVYIIVPRDTQITHPNTESAAQLIIWKNGRPLYALPITQQDSISYLPGMQGGDTLRTIFSQQSATLPSYPKRPIIWQHRQVTITDSVQVLPLDSYQAIAQGDYASFIIPPTQIITDTRHILRVRDTIYKVQDIYDDPNDSIPAIDTIPIEPGRRIGVFSVATDKQVSFSQGNLQYVQSTDTWRFAREQYEYIGADNIKDGALADRIDLFGWSANNTTAPFGVSTSTNAADYAGTFVDWGTNTICGDTPNTWRTLSIAEWEYLLEKRPNAANLQGIAQVNGVNGLIILPDDWVCPLGIHFLHGFHSDFGIDYFAQHQQFTLDQWIILEQSGAVFLPASKWRNGSTFTNSSEGGHYWSSTCGEISTNAHYLSFGSQEAWMNSNSLHRCFAVRLVHDTVVPEPPKRIGVFSVAADKQVSFSQGNLQYVQSTDTWRFAREQYELIGEDYTTLGIWDLFGWSGKDNNAPFGVSESANVVDYRGEFVDWGTNRIGNDAPATWRTLSRDEWQYLIEIRPKADELYGVAMVAGVQGMILLPDDWVCPEGIIFNHGCHSKDNAENFAKHQTFTKEQWNTMEEAGAIFLPAAGIIYPPSKTITSREGGAHYFSSDQQDADNAIWFGFRSSYYTINASANHIRRSVRLVHDTIVPTLEPEYVDLGLSVKWATFNVGASKPEDYGDYFAWGETEPKETYSWATYKWCDGTSSNMTKYNTTDGKTILEPEDDAAQVHWGDKWRMPTKDEMQELFDNCTWKEETRNGINGYIVTGPNGNSIFLPRAGFYNYDDFGVSLQKPGHSVYYWTSTIYDSGSMNARDYINAWDLVMNGLWDDNRIMDNTRRLGLSIRPVYDDRVTLTVIPTPEDAKVSFLCKGYQWTGNSIKVDKGKDVLYQVTNVDAGYLSQGDSIYKLTKDSILYVTLRPFSDGTWVVVDNSEYTKQEGYYVSRNNGGFASHSVWNYYVLPVLPGETYRVRSIAGQHAALWMAVSTAPNPATNTRPTKISCCANRGVAAYVADEVTIPDDAKYLIINSRNDKGMMVERKVPDPCLVFKVNDTLSINMMCVEGGTFMMGSSGIGVVSDSIE